VLNVVRKKYKKSPQKILYNWVELYAALCYSSILYGFLREVLVNVIVTYDVMEAQWASSCRRKIASSELSETPHVILRNSRVLFPVENLS
jgi:hypothetical protein